MVIMASTLIQAINECRHITTEELTRDTIRSVKNPVKHEKTEKKPLTQSAMWKYIERYTDG